MPAFLLAILTLTMGAVIAYFIQYKAKEPFWCIRSNTIIRKNTDINKHLSISFDKAEITTLTVSRIAIWNHGRKMINNKTDQIAGEELRIVSSHHSKILETTIIANNSHTQANRNICDFKIMDVLSK